MKIEIDYNGALAVCRIEAMDEPCKMVNFNDADTKSQTYAISAFRAIKEHWQREKQLERWKNQPMMHIRREIQLTMENFDQIQELVREGVLIQSSFDFGGTPTISVLMNDNHTTVTTLDWLVQDTEGRWWGMDNYNHRKLVEYNKIAKK